MAAAAVRRADVSTSSRDKASASDYAGTDRTFLIVTPGDVTLAIRAATARGADPALKTQIVRIAKRKGGAFLAKLPKGWVTASTTTPTSLAPFVSRVDLADAEADGPRSSWVQILRTGDLYDPRYGDFSITSADLATMAENFKAKYPVSPTKLPIDYNHGTSRAQSAEMGKAAGWIEEVALRDAGDELWCRVEWTNDAAKMIEEKEYQFLSASFSFNYKNSNGGEELGPTLFGAALTNVPVVHGMAATELSLALAGAAWLQRHTLDIGGEPDADAVAMFTYDEQRRRVQSALTEFYGVQYGFGDCGPYAGCYLVDMMDGVAWYREYQSGGSGGIFAVDFEIGADGAVTFTSTPAEVVVDYRPLATAGETLMAKTVTVKDAKGNDVQLAEDVILALAKEHAPKPAAGQGAEVVDLAQFTELSKKVAAQDAQLIELSTVNLALKKDAHEKDAAARVEKLVTLGKIAPADREDTLKLAIEDTKAFGLYETQMLKRPAVVAYGKNVGSGEDTGATSASQEAIALARTEQDANKTLSSQDALALVFRKNPELYGRYATETTVKV